MAPCRPVPRVAADFLRERYPDHVRKLLCEAENALGGMIKLPGTDGKPFFVGDPPKWLEDPVGDSEYVWSLNRMGHWAVMMKAYFLSGDERYPAKILSELENWLDCCPCPPTDIKPEDAGKYFYQAGPWRALEVGIRMFDSWSYIFESMAPEGLFPSHLLGKFVKSVHNHGLVLEKFSPMFWPDAKGNHYFMENLGLLYVAGMLPELKESEEWAKHAVRELERCVQNQFTPDGGHIEGCPHYHNACVRLLRKSLEAAKKYGFRLPASFADIGRLAADYSMHAMRPTGACVPWGDSDASDFSIEAAADGYLMFNDRKWVDAALNLGCEEQVKTAFACMIWESPAALAALKDDDFFKCHGKTQIPLTNHQRALKQAALRTGWGKNDASVFFACSTPVLGGHSHIDPMGFDFTANGRALIADPGRYCYREGEDRRNYKSAQWHSLLTVNGKSPFEYISSWSFGPQEEGGITGCGENSDFLWASARQRSFKPAVHSRLILLARSKHLIVVDRLDNLTPGDAIEIYYHIDSAEVELNNKNRRAESPYVTLEYDGALTGELLSGSVSEELDISHPSTRLCLRGISEAGGRAVHCAVITPQGAAEMKARAAFSGDSTVMIKAVCNGREQEFIF